MDLSKLVALAPMLDKKAYAELTHQKLAAVEYQIFHNILPIVQPKMGETGKGSKVYINMALLTKKCLEAEDNGEEWNALSW